MQETSYPTQEVLDFVTNEFDVDPKDALVHLAKSLGLRHWRKNHGPDSPGAWAVNPSFFTVMRRGFINESTADRWAVKLGVHPAEIWGELWWSAPEAQGLIGRPEAAALAGVNPVQLIRALERDVPVTAKSKLYGMPPPIVVRSQGGRVWYRWPAEQLDAWFEQRSA